MNLGQKHQILKKYQDIELFLKYLKITRNYTENTITSYEQELVKYFNYLEENQIKKEQITKEEIRKYLKKLDQNKQGKSTISHNISVIRAFYNFLLREGKITKNIWSLIKNPKLPKKIPNFLTTMEIEKLFSYQENQTPYDIRNRLIIELLFATGLRVSELVNIKLQDIDLANRSIRTLGKGKKERIVYYGEYAEEVLKKYLNESRTKLLSQKKSDYLFVGKNSIKLTRERISEILDEIVKKVGLQHHISPHVLRHTFATQLLNNGADLRSVQELLGHENLSTTQIYTHITSDQLRKAYLDNMPRK
ncbi:MAG: tyrosine recombinase [Bacilli bacterium]|nr:tyrosine recombinase [Bacilli bacterium]